MSGEGTAPIVLVTGAAGNLGRSACDMNAMLGVGLMFTPLLFTASTLQSHRKTVALPRLRALPSDPQANCAVHWAQESASQSVTHG